MTVSATAPQAAPADPAASAVPPPPELGFEAFEDFEAFQDFQDFEEYVRTRQDALLRSARRLVPDPVDAQDLVQTALVRTYPRWHSIADKGLVDAYMRRVMINTRTEWWRARKLDEVPTCELPDASIDDGSEQRADRAMLRDAMAVLAPKQRQVVLLRHYRQLSTEETARTLGMSVGTVKSTLHRALARLRTELEQGAYGYGRGRRGRREAVCTAANTPTIRPDAGIGRYPSPGGRPAEPSGAGKPVTAGRAPTRGAEQSGPPASSPPRPVRAPRRGGPAPLAA